MSTSTLSPASPLSPESSSLSPAVHSGTRLWPLSRAGFPKQFLCLTGDDSLFQQAAKRLAGLGAADIALAAPLIACNEAHRFLAFEQPPPQSCRQVLSPQS